VPWTTQPASAQQVPPHVAKPQRSLWIYLIDKIGQKGTLRKLVCNWQLIGVLPVLTEKAVSPMGKFPGLGRPKQIGQKGRPAV
jgi:hypothetical protein